MLTKREQQVLDWIRERPSITQCEIAERAGISRSSVAVHISNLTKKGAILGRQYVLATRPYAVVIGGANMDVAGKPDSALVGHDSNPGMVRISAGGAGRNVAHNLALFGIDVKLISAFGDDAHARGLMDSCRTAGIDVGSSIIVTGGTTSTYLFIMDEHGEMELAISDMKIFDHLLPECLERRIDLINGASVCVVDTNIPVESLRYLAENATVPLICDPVSTKKAIKLEGLLDHFHTLKPNRLEAEVLAHISIRDDAALERAAEKLLATGLERVFISLGCDGLYCADHDGALKLPNIESDIVNTTGAGDAMSAAIAWAYLGGETLAASGAAGLAASAVCAEAPTTINPALSVTEICRRMGRDV